MATRHVKVNVTDDDIDFAAEMDEEAALPDPPEAQDGDHGGEERPQRGYRE
jgi:hypothetical protein